MKIGFIHASKVMRLKLADVQLNGESLIVAGENEQGKSSFIAAMHILFGGKKAIPKNVVEDNDGITEIYADLTEDFRIEKKIYTDGKVEFYVKPLDEEIQNVKYSSPQDICNKLFNDLTFDPLEFQNLGKDSNGRDKKVEMLKKFLPDLKPLELIEQQIKQKYDLRTSINKEQKRNELAFNKMKQEKEPKTNLPNKKISVTELTDKKDELQEHKEKHDLAVKEYNQLLEDIETLKKKIEYNKVLVDKFDIARISIESINPEILFQLNEVQTINNLLKDGIMKFTKNRELYKKTLGEKEELLSKTSKPKAQVNYDEEIAKIKNEIASSEETNAEIEYRNKYTEAENAAGDAKVRSDQLTDEIEELRKKRFEIFKSANMPVEGLSFDEEGVYFTDERGTHPFEQVSESKRILISMKIGMALNPQLRTMFTKHGAALRENRVKELLQFADANDYQLIIERFDPVDGYPYIIIEDGKVIEGTNVSRGTQDEGGDI